MEMYQPTDVYHHIIFRHLHLYHNKIINLHSLICYVLEYELSDSKIGNNKNIQSYREIMYMDRYFHCLQVSHDLIVKSLLIIQ